MIATQIKNTSQADKMQGLVPLSSVAKAAIIDTFGDVGKSYELNMHWAARSYREVLRQYLHLKNLIPNVKRRIVLNVNANTHTATAPCDIEHLLFVAGICDGKKIPLSQDGSLVNQAATTFEEDICSECGQSKNICNELQVTETVNAITINDTVYDETVVKKLYPNGDYYIETTTPYWNINDEVIEYATSKKFVSNFDLRPCGCLDNSAENLALLQIHCPDTFYCYYSSCERQISVNGGYNYFRENGLIQLDYGYKYQKVYVEYLSFIKKINGQWYVPEVAEEFLIEKVKFRNIDGKSSVNRFDKAWRQDQVDKARGNMERIIFRFNLTTLQKLLHEPPTFSINSNWYSCYRRNQTLSGTTTTASAACEVSTPATSSEAGSGSVITITKELIFEKRKFTVDDTGTPMITGDTTWVIKDDTGGAPEKNIKEHSLGIVFNGQPLELDVDDQISYSVTYTAGATTVSFLNLPDGVQSGDKISFSYAREVVS